MNKENALKYLANKIYKKGETKSDRMLILVPKEYQEVTNLSDEDVKAFEALNNGRSDDDLPIAHYSLKWKDQEYKNVIVTLYCSEGFGASRSTFESENEVAI